MDIRKTNKNHSMNLSLHTMQLQKSWNRQSSMNTAIVLGSEGFCGYDAKQPGGKTSE